MAAFEICIILSLLIISGCNAEPEVVLEKSPDVVKETISNNMAMRCSVNISSNPDGAKHINSLVITRDGEHIAKVTQYEAAMSIQDLDNLKVTGAIAGSSGDFAYIELNWTYPSVDQKGLYVCEVNAIDTLGECDPLSKSLDVDIASPTIKDLIEHTIDLQRENTNLKNELSSVKTAVAKLSVPDPVAFSAAIIKHTDISPNQVIVYNHVFTNFGDSYDPNTGLFTCRQAGLYRFDINMKLYPGKPSIVIRLFHNDNIMIAAHANDGQDSVTAGNNVIMQLLVGDIVKVVSLYSSTLMGYSDNKYNTFSGMLIA